MKKIFLSSLVITSICAFAYTQTDVDNANFLAEKNIITPQTTTAGYRLDDTITRAEVAGIALKLKGVTLPNYTCKGYFSDVTKNDWICRAVELAADAGLVSRSNTKFRPQDKITRAEALSIIWQSAKMNNHLASDWKISSGNYDAPLIYDDANEWQSELISKARFLKIIDVKTYQENATSPGMFDYLIHVQFYPNRSATRAEVFKFAKNIIEYKTANFDGIEIENGNIVLYENGAKIKSLTTDAKAYSSTPCRVGDTYVSYFIIGQSGEIAVVKKSFGLCDADGGNMYLFFQNGILESLVSKIQTKFGVTLSSDNGISIKIINDKIVITGYFVYSSSCDNSPECLTVLSKEIINRYNIKILSLPGATDAGKFEWSIDSSLLF